MLHVVADENIPAVEQCLGPGFRVTRCNGRSLQRQQLEDADVLFVRSVTRVDRNLLEGTPVRFVGTATSGTEHLDTDWLDGQGIPFIRAAGANANSVAEYVLSAIASTGAHLEQMMAGGSVAVIGYGPVGRAVARTLTGLGANCVINDPWLSREQLPDGASLSQALHCNIICLHPELTRRQPWPSYHLLAGKALQGLVSGQLLINASRGPVIDNSELLQRLREPAPPAVVLDVWEGEPELDRELLARVNLGSAHIAGYSRDSKILATRMLCAVMAEQLDVQLSPATGDDSQSAILTAPEGCHGPSLARYLVTQCYDIRQDDQRLRAACSAGRSVGAAFDALRKNYPERNELAGRQVLLADESQRAIVDALGCQAT